MCKGGENGDIERHTGCYFVLLAIAGYISNKQRVVSDS